MIIGEGLVFFLIMIWGIYQVQKSLNRELELAKLQKNFLLSVTHELKTPIASVRLGLETLQKHDLEKETRDKVIEQGISETDRLNILIEKILFSTRLEDHGVILNLRRKNISKLLFDTLDVPIHTIAKNYNVNLDIEKDVYANVDDWAFKSIVINLFENALKYSERGSSININLKASSEGPKLIIEDSGIGIAEENRSKIFKKFYRVENEETKSVKGTGLGLYIVKSLINLHDAKIFLENNIPTGVRFVILFKK